MSSSRRRQRSLLQFTINVTVLFSLVGCGPRIAGLESVDYTPLPGDDWEVSTPAEQGMDPNARGRAISRCG